jgi:hypothetical protein
VSGYLDTTRWLIDAESFADLSTSVPLPYRENRIRFDGFS